jgi:serine O-acetyltransferase
MKGLIDNASSQEHQIALLWQAVTALSEGQQRKDCVPAGAQQCERFDAGELERLVK